MNTIRIQDQKDSGSRIVSKLSSRKYDPGYSSRTRIPDPNLDFLAIPDPKSRGKKASDPRSRIRNTAGHYVYSERMKIYISYQNEL